MTTQEPSLEPATIIMPGARGIGPDGRDRSVVVPRLGGRIGRYRLCLSLASGGMSSVYLARVSGAVGHHRFVALKCLKPALAGDSEFVEMFLDEARLASQINHPNVCAVFDYQAQGSISYLVMELLLGKTLAAVRRALAERTTPMPPAHHAGVVARIIADAAEGLHAAHELTDAQGKSLEVVHRDVSPENVFLTYDGNVKVVDFGVANTTQQHHHTQPGTLKGKYCYMQPEVLRGAKADRRADVWGLGVIAWELLTHERLFDGEHEVDTLRAVLEREIPRPSAVRPGLPPALDEIVMRALERDPARRYATTRELGRKLTWFAAEERIAIGLASLADFMEQLFPSGRACARQQLETVERMHDAAMAPDRDEVPTLAGGIPLDEAVVRSIVEEISGRAQAKTVLRRSPTASMAVVTVPEPAAAAEPASTTASIAVGGARPSWRWLAGLPIATAALLIGGAMYLRDVGERRAVSAAPNPAASPAPVAAPVAPPPAPEPAATPEVKLAPVRLPSGEVVYRIEPATTAPIATMPPPKPPPAVRRPAAPMPPAKARADARR